MANALKIVLVGCGRFARNHLGKIKRSANFDLIGVADFAEWRYFDAY
jgi:predicted dehydrogenase